MTSRRWNFDLVYGAFFFYGIVTLVSSLQPFLPLGIQTGLFIGSGLLVPLHALSLVTLVVGMIFACRLLREWRVTALIIALIADWGFFAVALAYDLPIDVMIAASVTYGLATCAISTTGFLSGRNPKSPGPGGLLAGKTVLA